MTEDEKLRESWLDGYDKGARDGRERAHRERYEQHRLETAMLQAHIDALLKSMRDLKAFEVPPRIIITTDLEVEHMDECGDQTIEERSVITVNGEPIVRVW